MAPKLAIQSIQGVSGRPSELPAKAPMTISKRAAEIVIHIEASAASKASAIQSAD
jgi:hypothetical protein